MFNAFSKDYHWIKAVRKFFLTKNGTRPKIITIRLRHDLERDNYFVAQIFNLPYRGIEFRNV
jgi:hypothetical protein